MFLFMARDHLARGGRSTSAIRSLGMNHLAGATSPYLLQHAENPVDWYEWSDEAFERARAEDKPLLVSVGYSSCHWCHVMAHESFESTSTAALMNELFVNVKVDREERPDVDAVTMEATVGMTGSGGWPTTVFMTPAGRPFYAGTYFPPEPRHGIPSFPELLRAVAETWRERRDDIERQAERIDSTLRSTAGTAPSTEPLTSSLLSEAARGIAATFEPAFGGFGRAPKFPAASTLELLLRRGDESSLAMVTATLDGMAAGGFYDVVGGGFHRYSVDDRWLVPHFEKMLYDNAVLASTYLHAWVVTERARYRQVVEETVDYMLRELALANGGLASAQDADTDGVEGLTYTWTPEEAEAVGLTRELLEPFEHGRFIVRGELDPELRDRVLARRDSRQQPFRDDKALASWNGLALAALAEAGYRLERMDWLDAARGLGEFLLGSLSAEDGRLLRSRRDGRASGFGFLDDYANVAHGLIELHVATGELRWLLEARRLALSAVELFEDAEHGGFFLSPEDGDPRVPRTKDLQDTPIPSGNSMLAHVLLRLSRIWGDDELERHAVSVFRLAEPALRRAPGFFAWMLCGLDLWLSSPREIAIVGDVDAPVARAALDSFQPRTVVAIGPSDEVPLLAGKPLVGGKSAVYVCERFACQAPVTEPEEVHVVMRVCLMIEGQEGVTWDDWVRLAHLTEEHGLEGLFRSDHYTAIIRADADALDAWATLAALAAITKRIRLGTLVSPATFRHPSVLARMAVTVDHISGGRVDVGMGSGWYEREHEAHGFPFLDGEEAIRALRRAGRGRRALVDGGSVRPRRPRVPAPRSAGAPTARAAAAPTARARRKGQAALRRARRPLCDGGEHARRTERRAARAEGRARSCVRGPRPRSRDARLLRDDGVLHRRDARRRPRARRTVPGDPRRRHRSGDAHRGAPRPLARRDRGRGRRADRRARAISASRGSSSST